MSEEKFLSALKEAKDLFVEKIQVETSLKTENGKLSEIIEKFKNDNEKLSLENDRLNENLRVANDNLEKATAEIKKLSEKFDHSKKFVKNYFKDQLNRMKDIERDGIYSPETFAYLVGDTGRSLCNTTLNESNQDNHTKKTPIQGKLSISKENRRSRYKVIELPRNFTKSSLKSDHKVKETNIKPAVATAGKPSIISSNVPQSDRQYNTTKLPRNKKVLSEKIQTTLHNDILTVDRFSKQKTLHKQGDKKFNFEDRRNLLDSELPSLRGQELNDALFGKNKNVKQDDMNVAFKTELLCNKTRNQKQEIMGLASNFASQSDLDSQIILVSSKNSDIVQDCMPDPELTLCPPIGPPSKSSTPQDPQEEKKFKLVFSPQETSHSIFSEGDCEGLPCTPLLPQLLLMEDELLEETEPQSPTIPSRSHSFTSRTSAVLAAVSPEHSTPKRKWNDVSFASLFGSDCSESDNECSKMLFNDTSGEIGMKVDTEDKKQSSKEPAIIQDLGHSPDVIVIGDTNFATPNMVEIPRKNSKTASTNETGVNSSSILFSSPQKSDDSPALKSPRPHSGSKNQTDGNLTAKQEKPKIALNFSLDDSTSDNIPDKKQEKEPQFKYKEVVRGKDKRAKLNGYFCADCKKYYGSLKLTDEEMQERLKACSKHRAQFSPPPNTPEHFWQVDFMNTNEYIEKGFLRNESELPPEKRRLKRRKKLQKE